MSKQRRLSRIFAADGKSVTLALDGYAFSSHTRGIDSCLPLLPEMVARGLDCALVTRGMLQNQGALLHAVPVVLRADSTVSLFDGSVPDTAPRVGVKEAVRLAAEGVVCMTFPGAANEEKSHRLAARLARQCAKWQLPLIVESLPCGYAVSSPASADPAVIAAAARYAVELGADAIKTRYSGTPEDRLIAQAAGVPVLALGGPKTGLRDYFSFVYHCMQSGASGVAVGRNIVQDPHPVGVVAGLSAIVHQQASAEQAWQCYQADRRTE